MLTRMVLISLPRDLPASASQSAGITGVSYCTWPVFAVLMTVLEGFAEDMTLCPCLLRFLPEKKEKCDHTEEVACTVALRCERA